MQADARQQMGADTAFITTEVHICNKENRQENKTNYMPLKGGREEGMEGGGSFASKT